jgi:hypothetical protein
MGEFALSTLSDRPTGRHAKPIARRSLPAGGMERPSSSDAILLLGVERCSLSKVQPTN